MNLMVKLSIATVLGLAPQPAVAQSIKCFSNMIFGEIVPCGASGSVTVRPDNSTGSSCVTVGGAPQSRARCSVFQGFPFNPIQVQISTPTVTLSNGTSTMTVNDFNIISNAGGTNATGGTSSPVLDVPMGATLNVGSTQAGGTYSGSFGFTAVFP